MSQTAGIPLALSAENLFNVNGMVAVVTGGGTGIGLMITKALVANGAAKVYILGRRTEVMKEAVSSIGSPSVIPVTCDVTSVEALKNAAAQIKEETGFVNLLVCNSGISGPLGIRTKPDTTLDEFVEANITVPIEDHTQVLATNVSAVWYTVIAFLRLLDAGNARKNLVQQSQVVAISSIGGFNKVNTGGFAWQLSVVLPQWNIRANVICPGIYPSEMSAPLLARSSTDLVQTQIPMKRAGNEEDMSGVMLFLASRAGAYCNGTVVVTDGGRLTLFPSAF
ncbi:NAD(P)-binding protein [Xylaria sp. CBS 124048]|nr:NAD(P)-binding protein [Xylaria sp. CBS 124048]